MLKMWASERFQKEHAPGSGNGLVTLLVAQHRMAKDDGKAQGIIVSETRVDDVVATPLKRPMIVVIYNNVGWSKKEMDWRDELFHDCDTVLRAMLTQSAESQEYGQFLLPHCWDHSSEKIRCR